MLSSCPFCKVAMVNAIPFCLLLLGGHSLPKSFLIKPFNELNLRQMQKIAIPVIRLGTHERMAKMVTRRLFQCQSQNVTMEKIV